jgi:L-ribulose-5-phosphate 3-epimerase
MEMDRHPPTPTRRNFLKGAGAGLIGLAACRPPLLQLAETRPAFGISLAQWSLHKELFAGKLNHLDFAATAREFDLDAIEYVSVFFKDKVSDPRYLAELKTRAAGEGVKSLLIMCDGYGLLGDPKEKARQKSVENHFPLLEAAEFLGCHSIRVNAGSRGSYAEQQKLAADGLTKLSEAGEKFGLNVIVENHGGLSSNGAWLAGVMKMVGKENCGTLPDFGNFRIKGNEWYDRYQGMTELMPYAKAVSAKSHDFDEQGNETKTDYFRMMDIVLAAGYSGHVGIEYEGNVHSEREGIRLTKELLQRCAAKQVLLAH